MANSATASARVAEPVPPSPDCEALCALFDELFLASENTRLVKGGDEPVYLPADAECPEHRIVFRLDYAPSALHEIATVHRGRATPPAARLRLLVQPRRPR